MQNDTGELVELSQKGDQAAFGKLYDLFAGKIYRFLYYRSYHRETAEDLTSIVFMKALDKLGTYRSEAGSFSSWLYRIAHNCLVDHYRQNRRHTDIDDVWDLADSRSNIEMDAENRDQWEKLKPYLKELSRDQREVLLLRIWDDLPYQEISRITGKSEASCKMAFSRGLQYLREVMPVSVFIMMLLLKNMTS
jgi:RNA polymerase sigma-70 factor, ECF subfamily